MLLVVALLAGTAQREHTIEIAAPVFLKRANQHVTTIAPGRCLQIPHHHRRHFVAEHGKGGFRQHGQARRTGLHRVQIPQQRDVALLVAELALLRHIALYQRHRKRRALRLRPFHLPQNCSAAPQRQHPQQRQPAPAFPALHHRQQPGHAQCRQQRHAVHPQQRRIARQRAVAVHIAQGQPGKARQEHPTEPFDKHPTDRHHPQQTRLTPQRQARLGIARQRGEQRQKGRKGQRRPRRQQHGHVAIIVQRDINPAYPGAKQPQPKGESMLRSQTRRVGAIPQPK